MLPFIILCQRGRKCLRVNLLQFFEYFLRFFTTRFDSQYYSGVHYQYSSSLIYSPLSATLIITVIPSIIIKIILFSIIIILIITIIIFHIICYQCRIVVVVVFDLILLCCRFFLSPFVCRYLSDNNLIIRDQRRAVLTIVSCCCSCLYDCLAVFFLVLYLAYNAIICF